MDKGNPNEKLLGCCLCLETAEELKEKVVILHFIKSGTNKRMSMATQKALGQGPRSITSGCEAEFIQPKVTHLFLKHFSIFQIVPRMCTCSTLREAKHGGWYQLC